MRAFLLLKWKWFLRQGCFLWWACQFFPALNSIFRWIELEIFQRAVITSLLCLIIEFNCGPCTAVISHTTCAFARLPKMSQHLLTISSLENSVTVISKMLETFIIAHCYETIIPKRCLLIIKRIPRSTAIRKQRADQWKSTTNYPFPFKWKIHRKPDLMPDKVESQNSTVLTFACRKPMLNDWDRIVLLFHIYTPLVYSRPINIAWILHHRSTVIRTKVNFSRVKPL